jgi:hypothetical protein
MQSLMTARRTWVLVAECQSEDLELFRSAGRRGSGLHALTTRTAISAACSRTFLTPSQGDLVIGYESYPVKQVVALVKVSAATTARKLYFEKTEGLTNAD